MKQILFENIQGRTGKKRSRKVKRVSTLLLQDILDLRMVSPRRLSSSAAVIFTGCVVLVFFVFVSKAFSLQILYGNEYLGLASSNRTRTFVVPAERGVIYDRKGKVLVRNKPAFSLVMDTGGCLLNNSTMLCKDTALNVSQIVNLNLPQVLSDIEARKPNVVLASGLSKDQVVALEAKLTAFDNISVVTSPVRDFIYKDIFAHLLGYVGAGDTIYPSVMGKTGVEQFYDSFLAGISGRKIAQIDSYGTRAAGVSFQEPHSGRSLFLYVDLDFQKLAYEKLKKAVDDKKAFAGAIVAQDPQTGGIIALVSYPAFDPEKLSLGMSPKEWEMFSDDPAHPFFDRVISAAYPPGSTFKVVTAAAALEEGVVTPYTLIFDPGFIQVGSYIFRNWKLDGHGEVNLVRAIQVSNDVYFYVVGGGYKEINGLGIERLSSWARSFGLGSDTGIDLEGEAAGFIPDGTYKDWYLGDTYITAIGQGDTLTTPLQMNNLMTYFANGGYLFRPKVVEKIEGEEEPEVEVLVQNLISKSNYDLIRQGLKLVTQSGGTAYPFFDFPQKHDGIEVAGKTGTSEYINSVGEESTHAWFTVFAPYDKANIVLTVLLEGGGSGADDAAPIARELLDYWFGE